MLSLGGTHSDSKGQSSSIETEESKRFNSALFAAIDALEANDIDYAFIGGVAAFTHSRPRPTQDIDIFVRPEDAENILKIFSDLGFETNRFNSSWLFKAYKDKVLIDIIFRSEPSIYFDKEMSKHTVINKYRGRPVRLVSPEDFIILKCAVHSEEGHHHWHDALSALSQAQIDWDYLIHRARKAPRRLLALLVYAQSMDIWIPNVHIHKLFQTIYNNNPVSTKPETVVQAHTNTPMQSKTKDKYLAAKIKSMLAESETTGALDIEVLVKDNKIVLRGQTQTEEQCRCMIELIRKVVPNHIIESQLQVANWQAPKSVEALQ